MELKKNPKFEIGRNSSLYFAVGLNIMLFITYNTLEYKTYDKQDNALDILVMNEELDDDIPILNIEILPSTPPPKVAPVVITIVEDIVEIEESVIESTETSQDEKIEDIVRIEDIKVEEIVEDIEVPFAVIENPPIYPGCEGLSKIESKKCFQSKIQAHIIKNFKYPEVALDLRINGKVYVLFVIDAKGNVSNIRTRGPDKILEKEANRIISLLPTMTPGKQRGRYVKVPYAIPIHFKLAYN